MADKLQGGIKAGSIDVTLDVLIRNSSDSTELTGLTSTDVTAYYWRQGGTPQSITVSDLTNINDAHSDGGWKEADATNMKGLYRFDIPDASAATGSDWVTVSVTATGGFVFHERFNLTTNTIQSGDAFAKVPSSVIGDYRTDVSSLALEATSQLIKTETESHPTLAETEASTVLALEATSQLIKTETESHPTLAEIEASTVLALEATSQLIKTETESHPTLAETEASTVLALEATSQSILTRANDLPLLSEMRLAASVLSWTTRTGQTGDWWAATFGNGTFVAVGDTGDIQSSTDAITWTTRTPAESVNFYDIVYAAGLFVAVAYSGTARVQTSPDGITWTARTPASASLWYSVAYDGSGLFAAVAGGGEVMTSPDGITWTGRTGIGAIKWIDVTYGAGIFCAVALEPSGTKVMTSPDGITWTARTDIGGNRQWISVTYGNGIFAAVAYVGTGNRVMTSPDGITWTARAANNDNNGWNSVHYIVDRFIAVAESGTGDRVMQSFDGITWTTSTGASDSVWNTLAHGGGIVAILENGGTTVNTSPEPTIAIVAQEETSQEILALGPGGGGGGATIEEIEASTVIAKEATQNSNTKKLFSVIESQRGTHTGMVNVFYWDSVNGNDSNSGLDPLDAKLTYDHLGGSGAHSLLTESNHDILIVLPGASAGPTTISEYVELDTRYTFMRGPGRDVFFDGNGAATVLKVSAEGCELSGIRVNTSLVGSQDAITVTGDFAFIHNIWIDYSRGHGIFIDNANHCLIKDFLIEDAAQGGTGHGINIDGSGAGAIRNFISEGTIINCNGDGIHVKGGGSLHNFIYGKTIIHGNSGYGVGESGSADATIISGPTVYMHHNTLGDYNLLGADSIAENVDQWSSDIDTAKEATSAAIQILAQKAADAAFGSYELDSINSQLVLKNESNVEVARWDLSPTYLNPSDKTRV